MNDKNTEIVDKMEKEDVKRLEEEKIKGSRKRVIKKLLINSLKPLIIMALIVCLLAIIISSILHYINLFDGTMQEGDWSNLPFIADYSLATSKISSNGEVQTGMSAQEIWDILLENDGRINKYLDSPEQLKKLLNAELITQYVDTRPNPDEPIDWDEINNDVNSKNIQGIVKLKRESADGGEKYLMKYTDPETFQSYIDKYNETGSEEDKQRALSYFTLGIEEQPYNISNPGSGTDGTAEKIEKGATILIPEGEGIGEGYDYFDWQSIDLKSSFEYKLKEQAGVTFDDEGFGRINGRYVVAVTTTFGAVGSYIDYYLADGTVIPCIIGKIIGSTESGANSWGAQNGKSILTFLVDRETWMTPGYIAGGKAETMHVKPGTDGFHMEWNQPALKVTIGDNYFDNPDFANDKVAKEKLTVKDTKSSKNTKIASLDKLVVGVKKPIIEETEQETEQEEKIEEVFNRESLNQILDSGTPKYYAKIASWSVKDQTIITDDPDFDPGLKYQGSQYREGNTKFEADTQVLMGTTDIDYQSLVGKYTMPLEYLLGFLFVGQDAGFVSDLAGLVYDSEIDISIMDNVTVDTTIIVDTYTKQIDVVTETDVHVHAWTPPVVDLKGTVLYEGAEIEADPQSGPREDTVYEKHSKTYIDRTETHTIDAGVTKANTWTADTSIATSPVKQEPKTADANGQLENMESDKKIPDKEDDVDFAGLAEKFRQEVESDYSGYKYVEATITKIVTKYYFSYIDIMRNVSGRQDVSNYVMSPAEIREKTDPNSAEPNFVTLFQSLEHPKAVNNINSAPSWLIEMFEKNSTTADMVDLTKYLLGKANGEDSEEGYNLSLFEPKNFAPGITNRLKVSDLNEQQLSLLNSTLEYYSELIKENPELETTIIKTYLAYAMMADYQKNWGYAGTGDPNAHYNPKNILRSFLDSDYNYTCCSIGVAQYLYLAGFLSEADLNDMAYTGSSYQIPSRLMTKATEYGWEKINWSEMSEWQTGDMIFWDEDWART